MDRREGGRTLRDQVFTGCDSLTVRDLSSEGKGTTERLWLDLDGEIQCSMVGQLLPEDESPIGAKGSKAQAPWTLEISKEKH